MDKILVGIMQMMETEKYVNKEKAIVKEMNEGLVGMNGQIQHDCGIVADLESKLQINISCFKVKLFRRNSKTETRYSSSEKANKWRTTTL